ncbi:MAG: zinc-dependent metalloprotease [Vitreoscilla sp.]|nr:zinc-dependent metalloprotease [Burkholderiales bacterium]MBP6338788.1 zinc-dependent metalloprotease [Vitreoscilla sp.]
MPMPLRLPALSLRPLAALGLLNLLAACATAPGTQPAAVPAAVAVASSGVAAGAPIAGPVAAAAKPNGAASAPTAAATPGGPPPFATVIKDARKIEGLLTLWQKDEKVWIELKPQDLDHAYFLSPKLASGIGENMLFGGLMVGTWLPWGRAQLIEFHRVHNQVQLLARNTQFMAAPNSPEARAVKSAFSDSLLGSAAVASQPHPDSKAVLIDVTGLFVSDLLGLGMSLQRQYRQNYSLDGRNSVITSVRANPQEVVLAVQTHFATASLAFPQPGSPPGAPLPTLPSTLPDARSLFIHLHYSIAKLPDQPMAPRLADPRVGHFNTVVQDFGRDARRTPKLRYVNRWRLEKQDPAAEISEPVKPITYWLDRNVPLKYRDSISRGVLEWNKAFEKIGFRNAVVVKVQPDDASFDTLDASVASIRWMTNANPAFGAIGPSQVDPRSGEILDADIGVESLSSRNLRATRAQLLMRDQAAWAELLQAPAAEGNSHQATHGEAACQHADAAAEQLSYALDVLGARGEVDPDSPEAEAFVQAYMFDVTMHEVGHTLGLRHNFRGSRVYSEQQISDPAFTRDHSLTGSVMEYAPVNLPKPGEAGGTPFQSTLGPYDYWAIAYAYQPMPAGSTSEQEAAELQRMAARSAEPELAFGTDEDNALGLDPESLMFDLGNDPVAFGKKRLEIMRDLIRHQETRALKPTEDYAVLRRALALALRDAGRAAGVLTRQIGGLRTLRDFPGSGRDPLQPVPAAVQREALTALVQGILAADGLRISPALARRLGPDFLERGDGHDMASDYAMEAMVLDLQRALLTQLMSDSLSARLLDAEAKADRPGEAMPLSEVIERTTAAVWGDVGRAGDIAAARRNLQREHLNRMANLILKPAPTTRADARGLVRAEARKLLARLQGSDQRSGLSAEAKAHLADSAESLRAALAAPLQRGGV